MSTKLPLIQPSFAAGEIDPLLIGRVDQSRYNVGLQTCENFVPMVGGGVMKRAPTYWMADAHAEARLVPFNLPGVDTCILEFSTYTFEGATENLMRIIDVTSAPGTGGNAPYYVRERDLSYGTTYIWTVSGAGTDEYYLTTAAGGDPDVAALRPIGDVRIKFTGPDAYYYKPCTLGTPGSLAVQQYGWGDNDTLGYTTMYCRAAAGVTVDNSYVRCAYIIRVPFTATQAMGMTFAQNGADIYFASHDFPPYKLTRVAATDWRFSMCGFLPNVVPPENLDATPHGFSETGVDATIKYAVAAVSVDGTESLMSDAALAEITMPWIADAYVSLSWNAVSGAIQYHIYKNVLGHWGWMASVSQEWSRISKGTVISGGDASGYAKAKAFDANDRTFWRSSQTGAAVNAAAYIGFDAGSGKTRTPARVRLLQGQTLGHTDDCVTSVKMDYSADGSAWTTLETLDVSAVAGAWQDLEVSVTPVAARYWRLLANSATSTGYSWAVAEVEWYGMTLATSFKDFYIEADTSYSPMEGLSPFTSEGNWPACVAVWMQRLWFANTVNQPMTLWATRIGELANMSTSYPLQEDDGIEVTLAESATEPIRQIVTLRDMVLFTDSMIWVVPAEVNGSALSATNFEFRVNGIGGNLTDCPAVRESGRIVYPAVGNTVRTAQYSLMEDQYAGLELSVFARHMLRDITFSHMAFANGQNPALIILPSGGDEWLQCTYLPEQDMVAWSKHELGLTGVILSICMLPDSGGDYVFGVASNAAASAYFVFQFRAGHPVSETATRFVDCYYDITQFYAAGSFSGLTMYAGLAVRCFYTAAVTGLPGYFDATVSAGGVLTVPAGVSFLDYSTQYIGCLYSATMTTLPMELSDGTKKTVKTKQKKINVASVRVFSSYGGTIGPDASHTVPLVGTGETTYVAPASYETGDKEVVLPQLYGKDGTVTIVSNDHYPLNILDIKPETTIGG